MAIQSLVHAEHRGHLLDDIRALLVIALVLAVLTPRGEQPASRGRSLRHVVAINGSVDTPGAVAARR
jgi:hypothetical protein